MRLQPAGKPGSEEPWLVLYLMNWLACDTNHAYLQRREMLSILQISTEQQSGKRSLLRDRLALDMAQSGHLTFSLQPIGLDRPSVLHRMFMLQVVPLRQISVKKTVAFSPDIPLTWIHALLCNNSDCQAQSLSGSGFLCCSGLSMQAKNSNWSAVSERHLCHNLVY